MGYKSFFPFLLLLFIILFAGAPTAKACSCALKQTVLEEYAWADVVVVTRAVSVEKVEKPEKEVERGSEFRNVVSTKMVVEKVYKGNLKVGDEMIFAQGSGANCIWTFDEESVDGQYLFYLKTVKGSKVWIAGTCGRSNALSYAAEDLLYLNKLDKVRGKTRISGSIRFYQEADLSVEGINVSITGAGKTYKVKTDASGVFEIYDLPAGKYTVEPEVPLGWKLSRFLTGRSRSVAWVDKDTDPKKIPIILEEKKHASLDIFFEIDNAIRGRLYDPAGKPMKGVCIHAIPAKVGEQGAYLSDCTDASGDFAITELPRGSYVLVVNEDGKISSDEPFKTFYYPNVYEREKAAVLTIGVGDIINGINIYAPETEETITVEGVFLYSDGNPVVDDIVEFKPDKVEGNIVRRCSGQD
ncbi:MAG TPA: carboxypeptidase-like regulatory domain-containing protein [Pyrinomonadaceae bacterium]|nr:carboxypeptidase-like regulatory domain-containing protein [Pyrinomonadaceae bacterium]